MLKHIATTFFALLVLTWQAAATPKTGEYVLVTQIYAGSGEWVLPLRYLHMTVLDDLMEFRYVRLFEPSLLDCEMAGVCSRSELGLRLPYVQEADGTIIIGKPEFFPNLNAVPHRLGLDLQHMFIPTMAAIAHSKVEWTNKGVTFRHLNRSQIPHVRFIKSDLKLVEDAASFAAAHEIEITPLDYCIVGQVAEISAKLDPSLAEKNLLQAVAFIGRWHRVEAKAEYYSLDRFPGTDDEYWDLQMRQAMLKFAYSVQLPAGAMAADLRSIPETERQKLRSELWPIYLGVIAGSEEGILASRLHFARFERAKKQSAEVSDELCNSILLEKFGTSQ